MADVTKMVVKVDLTCEKCKKKIKKVLCQIPEIENQVYDEKKNTVTITVVCCYPEKVKKKIFSKGGNKILGIEILKPPPKPTKPDPAPPPPKPVPACPPRDCCKECSKPVPPCPPRDCCKECSKPVPSCPPRDCCKECSKPVPPCPPKDCCKECFKPVPPCPPTDCCKECSKPVPPCPPKDCCKECSKGPCHQGHVRPPPPCYYPGWPVCDCGGSGCSRCYVTCEENPTTCTIM